MKGDKSSIIFVLLFMFRQFMDLCRVCFSRFFFPFSACVFLVRDN